MFTHSNSHNKRLFKLPYTKYELCSLSTFECTKYNQGFNCVCKHSETHKSSKFNRLCATYVYTPHTVSSSQRQTALPHPTWYITCPTHTVAQHFHSNKYNKLKPTLAASPASHKAKFCLSGAGHKHNRMTFQICELTNSYLY